MNRPIHFEIPAENPERAIKFYEKVFGWKFERWNGPMEYPAQPCVNTMDVADLDATIGVIEGAGGLCAVPKMPIPGVGWLAYFKDTEGHIFGAMQADPSVKFNG
jgi:predicted enzyme related to lactoylglutathione lyase